MKVSSAGRNDIVLFYDHEEIETCALDEGPLAGLRHRTVIDHERGAQSLALWIETHLPGFVVPLHFHDCEEIIAVIGGRIEADIGGVCHEVGPAQSILIPERVPHGFRVIDEAPVHLHALFSSSNPRIFRADGRESVPPWHGGASDHLA